MIKDQPPPRPGIGLPIWTLVISDMRERDVIGRRRYGTPLMAHNGRDALVDAYQEALDMVVYLRQAIEERSSAFFERERKLASVQDMIGRVRASHGLNPLTGEDHVATSIGKANITETKTGRKKISPASKRRAVSKAIGSEKSAARKAKAWSKAAKGRATIKRAK